MQYLIDTDWVIQSRARNRDTRRRARSCVGSAARACIPPARGFAEVGDELWIGLPTGALEALYIRPGLGIVLLEKPGYGTVVIGQGIMGVEGQDVRKVSNGAVIVALIAVRLATPDIGFHIAWVARNGLGIVGDGAAEVALTLIGGTAIIVS